MERQGADRLLARAKRDADPRTDTRRLQQIGIQLAGQQLSGARLKQVGLAGPDDFRGSKLRIHHERHFRQAFSKTHFDFAIGVHHCRAAHASIFDEMQDAPVGKLGHEEARDVFERGVGAEDFGEHRADHRDRRPAGRCRALAGASAREPEDDDAQNAGGDERHQGQPHGGGLFHVAAAVDAESFAGDEIAVDERQDGFGDLPGSAPAAERRRVGNFLQLLGRRPRRRENRPRARPR